MKKKGIAKFTAFCMAAGLTFSGTGMVSLATGADMSLVGIGGTARKAKTAEASDVQETVIEESTDTAVQAAEEQAAVSEEAASVQEETEAQT